MLTGNLSEHSDRFECKYQVKHLCFFSLLSVQICTTDICSKYWTLNGFVKKWRIVWIIMNFLLFMKNLKFIIILSIHCTISSRTHLVLQSQLPSTQISQGAVQTSLIQTLDVQNSCIVLHCLLVLRDLDCWLHGWQPSSLILQCDYYHCKFWSARLESGQLLVIGK